MDSATVVAALLSLGAAIWLLLLALVSMPHGWGYAAWSLVAAAASFGLLGWAIARRNGRARS